MASKTEKERLASRKLIVSFGSTHPAKIVSLRTLAWPQFAKWLTKEPPIGEDKASRGWFCPADFNPPYRHSDNFVSRYALTFDFDHVSTDTAVDVARILKAHAFALYTTFSHTVEKHRFRVVIPLSRPAGYDEFQAVSRMVASKIGIECVARESHVPAQMMYAPLRQAGGVWSSHVNEGEFLDVDSVLAEYIDWTQVSEWPRRKEADGLHLVREPQTPPTDKPGIIGDFCRTFDIPTAIERFQLPYTPTANPDRWTYANGSRPEGVIIYDDGTKLHSHHDTDPARGQCNAFDLVRLHRFGNLDAAVDRDKSVVEHPSYKAMVEFARELPELQQTVAEHEFSDLGPLVSAEVVVGDEGKVVERFQVIDPEVFSSGKPMDWIVRGILPRAELCVLYGESGSGKSFLALDLCAAITRGINWRERRTVPGRVVYVCAEGAGGFKSRLRAYAQGHDCELHTLPSVIPDAPNLLEAKDAAALAHGILAWGKPDVVVIDTLSATAPGGNENSGEDMGRVLSHCKFIHRKTGALVCLIHHSGKDASKGARGWSGLKAAADAEIEIVRNGDFRTATISKMKDGTDGVRLPFRLNTVALGFDPDGEEESSCIIEHVVDSGDVRRARVKPTGAVQTLAFDTLQATAAGCSVALDDLCKAVVEKMPKGEGRDQRKRDVIRAVTGLAAKKLAFMQGDRVSLTPILAGEGEWLE